MFVRKVVIPLQDVMLPLHFPSDIHFRAAEPIRSNPSSQLNLIVFGKTVLLPYIEPFVGNGGTPQSTATQVNMQ